MNKLAVVSVVLILLSGCGSTKQGSKEFDTANQLADAKQYKEAIAYLKQAVAQNPKNNLYVAKLNEIKLQYSEQSLSKVKNVLSKELTNQNLDDAELILQNMTEFGLDMPEIVVLNREIGERRQSLYQQLEIEYALINEAIKDEDWLTAHTLLKRVEHRFLNYENIQFLSQNVLSAANKYYLKEANTALKENDFGLAKSLLNELLQIVPTNQIAKALIKKANLNDNFKFFLSKAELAKSQNQWAVVIQNCQKAMTYPNDNNNCIPLLLTAKNNQAKSISEALLESMSEGRLIEAKSLFVEIKELNILADDEIQGLASALSQQAEYSAETYRQLGKDAIALILLQDVIAKVDPTFPELYSKIRQTVDSISDRSRRSIAVFDFNSPSSSDDDAGVIVANNLISRLFNNASRDIKILERENLKSILEEMKLGQIGVVSESTAKEMGRVYGIDYAIMGSVLLYKVDENTASSTKTIRYQIGEKIQDNIEYLNWKAINLKPSKKELMSAPKAKIMVPEYGEKEYEVVQTKKVGFLQLSFRIVNVLTGENTSVDTIERKVQKEDTSNAGVQDAGIKFDPMKIPTDTEILQGLTEEVVEHMAGEVLQPLQQLETFYFNEGQDRERRSEIDEAVEFYTYAIFNEKLKSVSASPVTIEAQKRIDNIMSRFRFSVN
jgi:curli biogenesis system outer membrane secretion channel CsgG